MRKLIFLIALFFACDNPSSPEPSPIGSWIEEQSLYSADLDIKADNTYTVVVTIKSGTLTYIAGTESGAWTNASSILSFTPTYCTEADTNLVLIPVPCGNSSTYRFTSDTLYEVGGSTKFHRN